MTVGRRHLGARAWIPRILGAFLALGAFWGCEDSPPEECRSDAQGVFTLQFRQANGQSDILGVTQGTVTLTARELVALDETRYILKLAGGPTYWLDLKDLGYTLPLTVGETYTMRVEHRVDRFLNAYALHFKDASGLRVMIESDWQDGDVETNYVYQEGYDDTGLAVLFTDSGCEPRQRDSEVYRLLATWQVTFTLDGESKTLFHKQQATLGPYTVRVVKAQREQFNAGNEDRISPQFSWILMPSDLFGENN